MKKIRYKVILLIVILVLISIVGFVIYQGLSVKAKEGIIIEYGSRPSNEIETYFETGFLRKDEKVDISQLDNFEVGKYEVFLSNHKFKTEVEVIDTKKPVIDLKGQKFSIEINQELRTTDIINSIYDKSGIKNVEFDNGIVPQPVIEVNENSVPVAKIRYDKEGEYSNSVTAYDNNGNSMKRVFTITVYPNYLDHVQGIRDLEIEQGSNIDWLENISFDNRVNTVLYDDSDVDIETPGEYELVYTIIGDNHSETEKTVSVTVIKKEEVVVEEDSSSSSKIRNADEACDYIRKFVVLNGDYVPQYIEFDHMDEYGYVIHGYDIVVDHTATSFWYAVSEDGRIFDEIFSEYVN
ncbi:MAG: hypothetical protein IAC13_10340 [Firmicutes bacterium]|uniref:Pesticidal crystal protein Cry22Aa Ig-like domain-containing protein n=1 Tax=Candidatus Scybalomonas excrementavium TaxID=2840943 RepID=A0A9D9I1W2_9FIRM|nr:hypothetical protein [Candidatus Scybalomonas excrementavium]